jgi:hypothetical protein
MSLLHVVGQPDLPGLSESPAACCHVAAYLLQMASLYNPGTPIYLITSCDQFELGRGLQLEQLLSLPLVRLKLIENHLANGTDAAAFKKVYW